MYVYYKKHKLIIYRREKSREDKKPTKYIIKKILKLSVPVTIGSLISIVHTMIDTITVTNGIQKAYMHIYTAKDVLESKATEMKGILSKVSTIVGLPQSITIAIGDKKAAQRIFKVALTFFTGLRTVIKCIIICILRLDSNTYFKCKRYCNSS